MSTATLNQSFFVLDYKIILHYSWIFHVYAFYVCPRQIQSFCPSICVQSMQELWPTTAEKTTNSVKKKKYQREEASTFRVPCRKRSSLTMLSRSVQRDCLRAQHKSSSRCTSLEHLNVRRTPLTPWHLEVEENMSAQWLRYSDFWKKESSTP